MPKHLLPLFCTLQEGADLQHRGELSRMPVFFMLLTGVRARTGLWRLPPVSEICHYHGETWGKGEGKSKIEKGVFWNPQRCACLVAELTAGGEIWGHQTLSLVCSADGCSSGFCTQEKDNMLAGETNVEILFKASSNVFYGKTKILFITTVHRET